MRKAPFADTVQAALLRPEKYLLPICAWRDIKSVAEPVAGQLVRSLSTANVLRLDDEFTSAAQNLSDNAPEHILRMLEAGQLPFDRVWIEWNERARVAAMGGTPTNDMAMECGYFLERSPNSETGIRATGFWRYPRESDEFNREFMAAMQDDSFADYIRNHPEAAVAVNLLSMEWDMAERPRPSWKPFDLTVIDREYQDGGEAVGKSMIEGSKFKPLLMFTSDEFTANRAFALGIWWSNQYVRGGDAATPQSTQALLTLASRLETTMGWGGPLNFGPAQNAAYKRNGVIRHGLRFFENDFRFLVTILYLLQHKATERVSSRDSGGSRMVHLSRTKWMGVQECRITAPRERVVQEAKAEAAQAARRMAAARRKHEVMGHWAERLDSGNGACLHRFQGAVLGRQECEVCGRVRWWRRAHVRGDGAAEGRKTYRITAPRQKEHALDASARSR